VKIWTDLSSIWSQITRLTDKQTDRRTDRYTEFSSLDHNSRTVQTSAMDIMLTRIICHFCGNFDFISEMPCMRIGGWNHEFRTLQNVEYYCEREYMGVFSYHVALK